MDKICESWMAMASYGILGKVVLPGYFFSTFGRSPPGPDAPSSDIWITWITLTYSLRYAIYNIIQIYIYISVHMYIYVLYLSHVLSTVDSVGQWTVTNLRLNLWRPLLAPECGRNLTKSDGVRRSRATLKRDSEWLGYIPSGELT